LEQDRGAATEEIAAATRALVDHQATLDGLSAQQRVLDADLGATVKLETEVAAANSAIVEVRAKGAAELTAARQQHAALKSRVEQELSEARRTALTQEIEKIDTAIATAVSAAKTADDKLASAETALIQARQAATTARKEHDDKLQSLQALPQGVEVARGRVVALRAATSGAVDAGRMAEAFVKARDLALALVSLETALQNVADDNAGSDLAELWAARLSTSQALTSATATLGPLQAAAAAAHQARDALAAGRDRAISTAVNSATDAVHPAAQAPAAAQ
jgi:chromosome segregation ATPase